LGKPVFDNYAQNYTEVHNRSLPPGVASEDFQEQKLEWVRTLLSHDAARLMDFGCGPGLFARKLAERVSLRQVVGIDESSECLAQAQELFSGTSTQFLGHTRVDHISRSEAFDLVLAFNVFHHIPHENRLEIAHALANRLAVTGRLAIWEHNPWNPITRMLIQACPFDADAELLFRAEAVELFEQAGLEVESAEYVNVTPPRWQRFFPFRVMELLLKGFPLGAQYRVVFRKRRS
jgi:2-polyprenyl-3-methyl-5-hydroxy-6-metoxy-1,4-benzoquinol methylase